MKHTIIGAAAVFLVVFAVGLGAYWLLIPKASSDSPAQATPGPTPKAGGGPRQANPQPAAQGTDPAVANNDNPASNDNLPLLAERESIKTQLEELEKALNTAEEKWKIYPKATPNGPAATAVSDALKSSKTAKDSLKDAVKKFNEQFPGVVKEGSEESSPLTPEQRVVANAVTAPVLNKLSALTIPLLGLTFLVLVVTLFQFFSFVRAARTLTDAKDEFLVNVQSPINELKAKQEGIAKQVADAARVVETVKDEQEILTARVLSTRDLAEGMNKSVNEVLSYMELQRGDRPGHALREHRDRFEDFTEQQRRAAGAGSIYDVELIEEAPPAKPHSFPAAVGEYLNMVKDGSAIVKPDNLNGMLVEDPDKEGVLVLVKNPPAVKDGTSYVVPSIPYFRSKQDFYNNYYEYYDCPGQQVGQVWIQTPATVRPVNGGWQLESKGQLDVRQ